MHIRELAYKKLDDDAEHVLSLDARRHFILCPDAQVSRFLCRELSSDPRLSRSSQMREPQPTSAVPGFGSVTVQIEPFATSSVEMRIPTEGNKKSENNAFFFYHFPAVLSYLPLVETLRIDESFEIQSTLHALAGLLDGGRENLDLFTVIERLDRYAESLGRSRKPGHLLTRIETSLEQLQQERQRYEQVFKDARAYIPDVISARQRLLQQELKCKELRLRHYALVLHHAMQLQEHLDRFAEEKRRYVGKPQVDDAHVDAVKRRETQIETCRVTLTTLDIDIEATKASLESMEGNTSAEAISGVQRVELPEEMIHDLQSHVASIAELTIRMEELSAQLAELDQQICNTQEILSSLPDFTRIAPNPEDWLHQLASSLTTAISMRYEEEETLTKLREEISALQLANAADSALFAPIKNFAQEIQHHDTRKKNLEARREELNKKLHTHRGQRDDLEETLPGLRALGFGCASFLIFILGVYFVHNKAPLLYAAGVLALATTYFTGQMLRARQHIFKLTQSIAEIQAELDLVAAEEKSHVSLIDKLITQAGCSTVRELEARFDAYCEKLAKLKQLTDQAHRQEQNLKESIERIPRLFKRICETLQKVDEYPNSPDEVERCVGSAIGKSRIYHETVRRLADMRNRQQGLIVRRRFLENQVAHLRAKLAELETKTREIMRANGFVDERSYEDITALIPAYYRFLQEARTTLTQREIAHRKLQILEMQLEEEQNKVKRLQEEIQKIVNELGMSSLDEFWDAAHTTSHLAKIEKYLHDTQEELDKVLEGSPITYWQAQLGNYTPSHHDFETLSLEACRNELEQNESELQRLHSEYVSVRELYRKPLLSLRQWHEIEEDEMILRRSKAECQHYIKAAARAMALLEEHVIRGRTQNTTRIVGRTEDILARLKYPVRIIVNLLPEHFSLEIKPVGEHSTPPLGLVFFILRLATIEMVSQGHIAPPLFIDATLQAMDIPTSFQNLLFVLEQFLDNRQLLVFSENTQFAECAEERGWPVATF